MNPDDLAAHRKVLHGFLVRLVKDVSLADDLAQEALIRATRAAPSLRGEATARTWLIAIALNQARDHFRATKRRPHLAEIAEADHLAAADDPEGEVLRAEMSSCILEHIDRLPPTQRDAVLMHHFAGLAHKDIAAALAVTEGNARVALHRGLGKLRATLGQECAIDFGEKVPCERR